MADHKETGTDGRMAVRLESLGTKLLAPHGSASPATPSISARTQAEYLKPGTLHAPKWTNQLLQTWEMQR